MSSDIYFFFLFQLLGFYKGMCFPLVSVGMLNSVFFGVYDNVRTKFAAGRRDGKATHFDTFLAGAIGGGVQAVPACSIELIKVKLQAQTSKYLCGLACFSVLTPLIDCYMTPLASYQNWFVAYRLYKSI